MTKDEYTPESEQDENETETVSTESTEETSTEEKKDESQDTTDWKSEALKYKAILDRNKNKVAETKQTKQSDDFGYDVKAYLKASGIKANEFDFVKEEVRKSGQDIDSLLENEYFQSKLDKFRKLNATADAGIKGTRSGGVPTDSVEYWAAKPIEDVPVDMRAKVVNYKLAREKNKGMFYNS